MSEQAILNDLNGFEKFISGLDTDRIMLVCGNSAKLFAADKYFSDIEKRTGKSFVKFSDFTPNPDYMSVENGVRYFNENNCGAVIAVGGGSAIDTAKCIKLYAYADNDSCFLKQKIIPNDIPLIAVPTTAGSGSEATHFAVIYHNGEKQSVGDDSALPCAVLVYPDVLKTLPEYQRKATMLDAFCHAAEAFWSVNANEESRKYSETAIQMIFEAKDGYLSNESSGNSKMLHAANIAGKAINIARTTAGHAMCYKLTTLFGLAHGHAAALCVDALFPLICEKADSKLSETLYRLADAMGCGTPADACGKFSELVSSLELYIPKADEEIINILTSSVNVERLKNTPVPISADDIKMLYRQILQ